MVIARLLCLVGRHDWYTISGSLNGWWEDRCMRCGKRVYRGLWWP